MRGDMIEMSCKDHSNNNNNNNNNNNIDVLRLGFLMHPDKNTFKNTFWSKQKITFNLHYYTLNNVTIMQSK